MTEFSMPEFKIDMLIILLGYLACIGIIGVAYACVPWRQFTSMRKHDEKSD